jgi:cytochrome c peroxidase
MNVMNGMNWREKGAWFSTVSTGISLGILLLLAGCHGTVSERPIGPAIAIHAPLGLPGVPIPPDNPPTAAAIALGRKLFYDRRLSKDASVACASCHDPRAYFTDGHAVSSGVGGLRGDRNAPTVLDAAYMPFQFWDGRAASLEEQAGSPIEDPVEMNQSHTGAVRQLNADPSYGPMFRAAFGSPDITIGRVEKAVASFERTLLSGNSPFDRYEYGGDKSALSEAQIRGLAVFQDPNRGNCAVCHTITRQSALFTDGKFHNTGEGVDGAGDFIDVGRYRETKVATDTGAFLTPTLRNVAKTPPYMHDGHLKTLKDVVDFYAGQGNSNPYLDKEMKSIHLSGQDRADLVEFLQSLTGDMPPNVGPPQ